MPSPTPQEPVEFQIPKLPTQSVKEFIPYISKHPDTPLSELLEPYKAFESELRKVYAQDPTHEALIVPNVNLVPIFDGHEKDVTVRARSLETESDQERSHFIMPLKDEERKKSGSPAVVSSLKEFQKNFNLFSESSLIDLDWDNVVAAGSSVTTALLPVPGKWAVSKRSMRQYYHENLAPASDVDLFLYGMNEEQARHKIIQIEQRVKDSILHEVTTIRTKNAITIASQYPTRHIQIVLRLYDSVSQIITGFDVDCACLAYDGKQVYAAPRAIAAFMTQSNTIDLSRRSPSYENRLSKYSHRGFEVNWPMLDRTKIDPTIFERSFGRTQGLARLLILEKLPKASDRDSYMAQRREERGRPALSRWRNQFNNSGNLKDQAEDEVSDWIEQEDVSSYHSMTVPYGPKYGAARITRLLYAKDLLLNAEWNQPKDREVYLHRHPCFFSGTSGTAEDILQDCCGHCPVPTTDEEIEVAEDEGKANVSGALEFMKDDPGRQAIGSFNPITDDEWTTMAYVGDTARLCQAIVDHDIEHVQDWLQQDGVDVNRRDFVGRTPLHLATMASTPEIVKLLIDNNARMIARLQDGRTALHIAAARGSAEMVKALMDKSLENEEKEEENKEARLEAKKAERKALGVNKTDDGSDPMDETEGADDEGSGSEITLGSEDSDSMTMGSFIKVSTNKEIEDGIEESTEEPDIYEVDVIAWDYNLSPLHCAIINGHLEIIELLVSEYGADVLLPVKLIDLNSKNARGAILSIVLALFLPCQHAEKVVKLLLRLGASSAQGDMNQISAFHYLVSGNKSNLLKILLEDDRPASLSVVNKVGSSGHSNFVTPLLTAVERGYSEMVSDLISIGAKPQVSFDEWIKIYLEKNPWSRNNTSENNMIAFRMQMKQPVIAAANVVSGKTIDMLLAAGADPATLDPSTYDLVLRESRYAFFNNSRQGDALLDLIQKKLKELRNYDSSPSSSAKEPEILEEEANYTQGLIEGSYHCWSVSKDYQVHKAINQSQWKSYEKSKEEKEIPEGMTQKKAAIAELIKELENTERNLIAAGAKTFDELYPEIAAKSRKNKQQSYYPSQATPAKPKPFKRSIRFHVPDINDVKKTGYIRLFEAAWNGDLDTIKSLTLTPWATKKEPANPPLQIAVQDSNGFSPFSIAVLRGHLDLARSVVSICMAQYQKDDDKVQRQRWMMRKNDDSDSDCEDSDDENALPIISELVDDEFTVDDLGAVSNVVKSRVTPSTMMGWTCKVKRFDDSMVKDSYSSLSSLLEHAVTNDKMEVLKLIIELGAEQQALLAEEPDDRRCYSMNVSVFDLAIKLGRTAMIAEMIEATGVGIPLNTFVKNSGVEENSKPKYYQGLSVGGKKRADWAQAPNNHTYVGEYHNNPLLEAAFAGSIESVEWLMSDAPMRRYKEFAAKNKADKRIKTLHESGKGFEQTVSTFLNDKSELVLHCAILSRQGGDKGRNGNAEKDAKYMGLIKHILSVAPETLEQKSSKGYTPLQLAVLINHKDMVSYLISMGANQRHRDRMGRNMLHSMLANLHHCRKHGPGLKEMIELFNKQAIKPMLLERTSQPESATPLAYWMLRNGNSFKKPDILEVLAKYSDGEDLAMINSEGDLPLHFAIKIGLTSITSFLLAQNPSLLYRENSTGRTPLEMSREIYHASCVKDPISLYTSQNMQDSNSNQKILSRAPASFLPAAKEEEPEESKKRTFEICTEKDEKIRAEGGDRKRRLVSLNEANEVAKRVSLRSRWGGSQAVVNGGLIVGEGVDDVVSTKMAGTETWGTKY